MLFQPTFIIIIHGLNDKAEIKYEIKVGNNLNNIVDTVQRHKVQTTEQECWFVWSEQQKLKVNKK